jgi:hypothetical protein
LAFCHGGAKKALFQDNISKIDTHEGSYVIVDCRVFAALPTQKIDFRPAKIAARFAATAIVHKIDRHDIDLCGPTLAVRGI